MRSLRWVLVLGALAAAGIGLAPSANAVPAFARREGLLCQNCHFRVPELNQEGHDYLLGGLRERPLPAERCLPRQAPAPPPCDRADRSVLGEPVPLPSGELWSFMLSPDEVFVKGEEPAFERGALELHVIAPWNPNWSALAAYAVELQAGPSSFDVVYGQYISPWQPRFGSGRAGRVLPFAIELNQGGPTLSLSTPVVLEASPDTGSPWSPTTLLRGAEVGLLWLPHWAIYLGAGRPILEDSPGNRSHTDLYASGERIFDARGDSITGYLYLGQASLAPDAPLQSFSRWGGFGNLYRRNLKVIGGFLAGRDHDLDGVALDNVGYFLTAEQLLSPRWAAYGRYDGFRQDLSGGGGQRTSGPTLGVVWWADTSAIVTAEAQSLATSGAATSRTIVVALTLPF